MRSIWIALRRASVDNHTIWKWSDGSPFVYENWQLFQPNDCCGDDVTCAKMNWLLLSGAWFDTSCLEKLGVVCKYDPSMRTVPITTTEANSVLRENPNPLDGESIKFTCDAVTQNLAVLR
ncbi:unnamed protein product [Enterobius vermicularis]|uniref:C-type lectin domain-containing protein n=1 Tax=Enterobius vermicularis TaxID=51028 RepID=A0A0N4VJV3_ENTVE|nr:unnamed protein product [Enterobius vermicularis]